MDRLQRQDEKGLPLRAQRKTEQAYRRPMVKYFVERAYERARGKVAKIENELNPKYGEKLETFYIDSTENNPKIVLPEEAKAWDYSVNQEQLKKIEEITYENRERIEESARLRGDKENPLAVITSGIQEIDGHLVYRNVSFERIVPERISGRDKQGNAGNKQGISSQARKGRSESSFLKSLLRQERGENPVIWASIVLAREILLGKPITNAKIEKLLPSGKFDGTQRQYAADRVKTIAEHCKATQENYRERIDQAVQLAEVDVYWNKDVMREMYNSFRKDGEEYGIVKQKLLQWLRDERRKDLDNVKGLTSSELGIDVSNAIENALEAEPQRKPAEEKPEAETEETDGEAIEGVDDELLGAREQRRLQSEQSRHQVQLRDDRKAAERKACGNWRGRLQGTLRAEY